MAISFFTNSANSYGSAIPFQRIVEPAQLGLFLNLEQAELLRVQRYNQNWRFYFAKHWIHSREDSEPLVTVNFTRWVADKSVSWLVKNGFDIEVPEALRHVVGPLLAEVWEYNNRDQFVYMAGMTGAVTGDIFVLVTYAEPSESSLVRNPNTQGRIKINLLGSEQVYPSWDPLDVDTLTSVRIETIYYDDRNQLTNMDRDDKANHQGRQLYVKRYSQIFTPEHIIEQAEGGQPLIKENLLREIPIVHIRNLPLAREFYGLSDLDGIVDLQRTLNEVATDVSDVINYQAQPVTVIKGAKASQLERGARQIWSGLPVEADIFNLNLETDMAASYTFMDWIKTSMLQLAETPAILLEAPPISNTSGVALHLQYQPIVDKTMRKKPFYEKGFEDINYFVLRLAHLLGQIYLPFDLCKTCGGRIVEVLDDRGPWSRLIRRCYNIDPRDFSWQTPEQTRIKYLRQNSLGEEIREDPFWLVKEQHKKKNPSAWDPEEQESQQAFEDKRRAEKDDLDNADRKSSGADTKETTAKGPDGTETTKETKHPEVETPSVEALAPQVMGDIRLPAEPESVRLSHIYVHPISGERRTVNDEMLLVPTECENPQFLDPYSTKVTFRSGLPRDHALDIEYWKNLEQSGYVSRQWVRRQLNQIPKEDWPGILKEIDEERTQDMRAGGSTPSEEETVPGAALEAPRPSEMARAGGAQGHNEPEETPDREGVQ